MGCRMCWTPRAFRHFPLKRLFLATSPTRWLHLCPPLAFHTAVLSVNVESQTLSYCFYSVV